MQGKSLDSLGTIFCSMGKYQKAIEFSEKALYIERKYGYRQGESTVLGNLGNAYTVLGDYQSGKIYHLQLCPLSSERK